LAVERERQDEIGLEIEDLRDIAGSERGDPWLLTPRPRWVNHIARDANDAGFIAEKIKALDDFLGKANDPLRRVSVYDDQRQLLLNATLGSLVTSGIHYMPVTLAPHRTTGIAGHTSLLYPSFGK
jgi:hypothetical protein